ncbi:hypothetical protein GQ457_08G034660 [Hibiscus cannabinus]
MKDTSPLEASGENVKALWDKQMTMIFCDLCIEILNVNNFENVPEKSYTQTIEEYVRFTKKRIRNMKKP